LQQNVSIIVSNPPAMGSGRIYTVTKRKIWLEVVGVGVRGAGVRIIKSNATTEARNGFE
jgi:hypothetical protein